MAIHPVPSRQLRPCPKSRSSPIKARDHQSDIKVASHKLTLQHSVRSQKLDERQLNKFFKSLEDLKIKRILQIDKEMSEQEEVLEKLNNDKEAAKEQRLDRRGNSSKSANGESELSFVLPDHFKRGPRPSLRRGSGFDLYAFMMRRESDVTPRRKQSHTKTRLAKQSKRSPIPHRNSSLKSLSWEEGPVVAKEAWNEPGHRVVSPGKSEQLVASPSSHFSAAESISIGSLPPSSPDCDSGFPPLKHFPSGSDWLDEVGSSDVNKGFRHFPRTKQPRVTRGRQQEVEVIKTRNTRAGETDKAVRQNRTLGEINTSICEKLSQRIHESSADKKGANSSGGDFFSNLGLPSNRRRRGPPVRKLKKAVSFLFPVGDEDDHGLVASDESLALGAGIMHKNSLLKDGSEPSEEPVEQCKEPDCIFHNKAYRRGSRANDEYTIDDYYRTVRGKPTVSPLFMPADSPRLWSRSRRQAVRPPSPSPSDFLREFDSVPAEAPKSTLLSDSDSFLSVRRPLKGSNRERMLKDKEENVRTTFKVMRQKMAGQRPLDFNQNYGTPTPNWKILNPLKLRHKINQSNPLHARWGL